MTSRHLRHTGFTLIEALITVAIVAIVLALAIPSFQDYILVHRMLSVNEQLVTDLQLARSEAVSRKNYLHLAFVKNSSTSCYSLYTNSGTNKACNCTLGVGSACSTLGSAATEVRTVAVDRSLSVSVETDATTPVFAFDPVTGGIVSTPTDHLNAPLSSFVIYTKLDSSRWLRTTVSSAGRPTVCASTATLGIAAC